MAAAKPSKAQERLSRLEKELKARGVRLGYERLEYAGLRLKSGLCWFRGSYYLFVDRLKTVPERIEHIEAALDELDELAAQGRLDQPGPEAAPPADAAPEAAPEAEPAADAFVRSAAPAAETVPVAETNQPAEEPDAAAAADAAPTPFPEDGHEPA
ncbi:MAG: hypothetical protein V1797_02265 [Pseudomonadota bacterium]